VRARGLLLPLPNGNPNPSMSSCSCAVNPSRFGARPRPCAEPTEGPLPPWATAVVPAVVALSTVSGAPLGTGFWITAFSILTTWSAVGSQAQGLRVTFTRSAGQVPVSVDGVLTFGVQEWDLAVVNVEPMTFPPPAVPTVLPILAGAVSAGRNSLLPGQKVFTFSAASGVASLGAFGFASGDVGMVSVPALGCTTIVRASGISYHPSLSGAPLIRTQDNTVVGIVQGPGGAGSVQGVSAAVLQAFLLRANAASATTLQGSTVQVSGAPLAAVGSVTVPAVSTGLALGHLRSLTSILNPGTILQFGVPLLSDTPSAAGVPLGQPLSGSTVYSEGELSLAGSPVGTLVPTLTASPTAGIIRVASAAGTYNFQSGYAQLSRVPVQDISGLSGAVHLNAHTTPTNFGTAGYVPLSEVLPGSVLPGQVTVCATPTTGSVPATDVFVSALVPFDATEFCTPATLAGIASEPGTTRVPGTLPASVLFAAPLGSSDFLSPTSLYGPSSSPLQVYAYVDPTTLTTTVQWQGTAVSTGDPVLFQATVTFSTGASAANGEVSFAYGVLPGRWAGTRWLVATKLGVPYPGSPQGVPLDVVQGIRLPVFPTSGSVAYFGRASRVNSETLVQAAGTTATQLERILAPQYVDDGTGRAVPPTGALLSSTLALVQLVGSSIVGTYAAVAHTWDPFLASMVSVGGQPVGTTALSTPSLLDAIVGSGQAAGSQQHPLVTATSAQTLANATPVPFTDPQLQSLLASVQTLSSTGVSVSFPTASSVTWTPTLTVDPTVYDPMAYYLASVFTAPAAPVPGVVGDFNTVSAVLTFDQSAFFGGSTVNPIIVLQLAGTDSSGLYTSLDVTQSTAVVLYNDGSGNLAVEYRGGYSGSVLSHTVVPIGPDTPTLLSVPVELAYNLLVAPATTQATRVASLVLGHPPYAGNSLAASPYTSPIMETLVPVTLSLPTGSVTTSTRLLLGTPSSQDPLTTWCVTSTGPWCALA